MKAWIARRVEQWRRIAHIVGLGIQGAILTGVAYPYLDVAAWWIAPFIFVGVLAIAFLAAWAYYGLLGMRVAEQHARFDLDVRDQTVLSPKEARLLGLLARALRGDAAALDAMEVAAHEGSVS